MKRTLAVTLMLAFGVPVVAKEEASWSRVKALRNGSAVLVAMAGEPEAVPLSFVSADDDSITARHPRTGIVTLIPKEDIVEIVRPAKGPSWAGVSGAAAVGALAGWPLGVGALFSRCNGSCGPNVLTAVLAMVGLPIAAAVLTAQATRRKAETIY